MRQSHFSIAILCLLFLGSCSKGSHDSTPPVANPEVWQTTVSGIGQTSAYCTAGVRPDGNTLRAIGFCWATSLNPTIVDDTTNNGTVAGNFSGYITNLSPSTLYHVRAYVITSTGTFYGAEITFETAKANTAPVLYLTFITSFTDVAAMTGGTILSDGGSPVTARGVCWSETINPTTAGKKIIEGSGTGDFFSLIEGLTVNTTYHVRAFATNSVGTTYGEDKSFITAYAIGQKFGGGKIFFIDASEIHGLIAAESDQTNGIRWDQHSTVYATNAVSMSDGNSNTTKIINKIGSGANAASSCKFFVGGGYNDWYLPSVNQLFTLFQQKDKIGGFSTSTEYWSSTESADYHVYAYSVNFVTGATPARTKNEILLTRAIRNF